MLDKWRISPLYKTQSMWSTAPKRLITDKLFCPILFKIQPILSSSEVDYCC